MELSTPNFQSQIFIEACTRNHVASLRLFGSLARGEANAESDIDLLVTFDQGISLLQFVAFERELSAALGRKVDLLTEAALSPYLRDQILHDCREVYSAY